MDIRLLTLCKQHYLDNYDNNIMPCQISCLGYYDGLDIIKIEKENDGNNNISKKGDLTPVSNIWYNTGNKIKELKGGYSNQNISLFRYINNDDETRNSLEQYWREEKKLPFFAVGFLKLKNSLDYSRICKDFENDYKRVGSDSDEKKCRILGYCTYDNADLVLLFKSNCIINLKNNIKKIELNPEVLYLHSIIGVEEEYLKECKNEGKILNEWKGEKCFIEERIPKFILKMVTTGNSDILNKMNYQFQEWKKEYDIKGYDEMRTSYTLGHANTAIILSDTDIKSMLTFLLPSGIITHNNGLYGEGVYNIESDIWLEDEKVKDKLDHGKDQYKTHPNNERPKWCRRLIGEYREFFEAESENVLLYDESLYSYYQALIQTLNTLDQYEGFEMSKDIFYLLYRSFAMFLEKLQKALTTYQRKMNSDTKELLKKSMCRYIECVNSVIYHTVHTDQIYLMIPGYSGTSFSIPLKLNMFYLYFVESVSKLLKDKNKKYSFIITPVMESRPVTDIIEIGDSEKEKIICIQLSQRSLYFSKALLIILTHEIAHYIGGRVRERKKRMECIIRTMAYYIAEGIIPENEPFFYKESCIVEMIGVVKERLQIKLCTLIYNRIVIECKDGEFHADYIKELLNRVCLEVISEDGCGIEIYKSLYEIPVITMKQLQQNEKKYLSNMRAISKLQRGWDNNRRRLLSSRVLEIIIAKIITIYREVFSDVVASLVLQCDFKDYQEAFYVSEGSYYEQGIKSIEQTLREYIAETVLFPNSYSSEVNFKNKNESSQTKETMLLGKNISLEKVLISNMSNYVWMKTHLSNYAKQCKQKVLERLKKDSEIHGELKKLYSLVSSSSYECEEVYSDMLKKINEYINEVEQEHINLEKNKTRQTNE